MRYIRNLSNLILLITLLGGYLHGQVVVWSEDFTSGGTGWTLNSNGAGAPYNFTTPVSNGSDPNSWIINSDYGGYLTSTTVGGSGGNFLHVTCTNFLCSFIGAPGPVYLNSPGNSDYNTNRVAVGPVISGATLTGGPFTLSFNWMCDPEAGGFSISEIGATLIYSINGGAWQEYPTQFEDQSDWTTFSISLATLGHSSGQSFQIGFRWFNNDNGNTNDPPMMIDDIRITKPANSITTNDPTLLTYCPGDNITVPFTSSGTFNAGNIYTAQLSDASGSFATPVTLGTLMSTANSGTINGTIPMATPAGSGYRVRVVSSNPAITGTPNPTNITINPTYNPTVTISANPGTTICAGENVTFTATVSGLSISPMYQWKLNGMNVGTNSPTYSTTTLNNGDQVWLELSFIGPCNFGTVNSNTLTITVSPSVAPSVTITANPGSSVCAGQSITFTATPTGGGSSPSYQWKLNGANVGTNSATYTLASPANGDQVQVVLTSSSSCAVPPTATSNTITVTVNPSVTPSVTISANPGTTICPGQSVTFTATPTNGGSSPSYQWQVNGMNVGTNSSTYTYTPANGDQVQVIMTSNAACPSTNPVNSNTLTITHQSVITYNPNIAVSPGTSICQGQTITFTEINNYANTNYQWNVDGNPVSGATTNVFSTNTLTVGTHSVTVTLTPVGCGTAATSNPINVTVNSTPSTSVSISANPSGAICLGTSVTFTATPTNGGASPAYAWTVNGNPVGTNSPTFTSSSLQNGDVVQVTMTSSLTCAQPVQSNTITMTVNNPLPVSVNISANTPTTICAGTSVTFTATPTNGGANPTYQWQINGVNVSGATNPTFTTTTLNNNDVVTVVMTSSLTCVSGNPATSNAIQFQVQTPVTPSVTISANPNTPVCQGDNITFTATPANTTNTPSYQWLVNGNSVSGATSSTFSTTTLNNGDVVSVLMTSNDNCVTQSVVTSNTITVTINTPAPVSVSIESNDTTVCAGTQVTFTATANNAGTPTYQWQVNGVNQGSNSPVFTYTPANGDVVTCIVTSSLTCVSNNPATSAPIQMTVFDVPTLTCSAADTDFGQPTTFNVTIAGGQAPYTFTYDFGDGNQITSNNTSENHTYNNVGAFNYLITVVDANGCSATCNGTVNVVNPPIPVASFGTQNNIWAGCAPLTINFVNMSQNAVAYDWNFGDGNTSTNINPTHTYAQTGTYVVRLIVSSPYGADTAFATVVVHPSPTAGIQVLTTTPDIFEPTQFQDKSIGAAEWFWDFGDNLTTNDTSSLQNPQYQYTQGGSYTVTLIVTNAFGCKDTTTYNISISTVSNDAPQPVQNLAVYPNPFADQLTLQFSSTDTNAQLQLFNALGQLVSSQSLTTPIGNFQFTWNLQNLTAGVYQLVIQQKNSVSTIKVVKQF